MTPPASTAAAPAGGNDDDDDAADALMSQIAASVINDDDERQPRPLLTHKRSSARLDDILAEDGELKADAPLFVPGSSVRFALYVVCSRAAEKAKACVCIVVWI